MEAVGVRKDAQPLPAATEAHASRTGDGEGNADAGTEGSEAGMWKQPKAGFTSERK